MPDTATATRFHIGEILTAATGTYLCPFGLEGFDKLVRHVTGQSHLTHQLGRAGQDIAPHIREQFPWIAETTVPPIANEAEGRAFLETVAAAHGEYHEVKPLPDGAYVGRDPIAEWVEIRGEQVTRPLTVKEQVAMLVVNHMRIADSSPGGNITCACGQWDAEVGDCHSVHVADRLAEAGLLAAETLEATDA